MGIINMIQKIKQIHTKDMVMVKIGKFYHCYGKDAVIMMYLFGYKLQQKDQIFFSGFPSQVLNKVKATLENKKINYLILDRRNNYEVDETQSFRNLNNYEEIYEKAKKYKTEKTHIEAIYKTLIEKIGKEGNIENIKEIEKVLSERRKV